MAIFGRRQKGFKPSLYDSRRRSRRLPRWLVLLLLGIFLGAGGVIILQASYGPKRLTVLESQKLTDELATTSLERQQLQSQLSEVERTLSTEREQSSRKIEGLQSEVNDLNVRLKPLHDEIELLINSISAGLKFDPIGIAAAAFTQAPDSDNLSYQVLLLQESEDAPTYEGRIEVTFEGRYPNGRAGAVKALVVPFELDHYSQLVGKIDMPNSFQATRGTLRVYRADGDRALSYRTYNVDK